MRSRWVTYSEWRDEVFTLDAGQALGDMAVRVMLVVDDIMNDAGAFEAMQYEIADVAGLTIRSVRNALHRAEELGYLSRLIRGHRVGDGGVIPSLYQATIPLHRTVA